MRRSIFSRWHLLLDPTENVPVEHKIAWANDITAEPSDPDLVLSPETSLDSVWAIDMSSSGETLSSHRHPRAPSAYTACTWLVTALDCSCPYFSNSDDRANHSSDMRWDQARHSSATSHTTPRPVSASTISKAPTNLFSAGDQITGSPSPTSGLVASGVCRLETWTTLVLLERTAAAFGRTDRGWHILYITRDGGIIHPPTGDVSGGKVLAYDTWGVDVY